MTAPSITRFLLVRIAEDEAYLSNDLNSYDSPHTSKCNFPGDMTGWCDCGLRDKLLAECAAKRKIVSAWSVCRGGDRVDDDWVEGRFDGLECAIAALAAVYNTHPDYSREWAL